MCNTHTHSNHIKRKNKAHNFFNIISHPFALSFPPCIISKKKKREKTTKKFYIQSNLISCTARNKINLKFFIFLQRLKIQTIKKKREREGREKESERALERKILNDIKISFFFSFFF